MGVARGLPLIAIAAAIVAGVAGSAQAALETTSVNRAPALGIELRPGKIARLAWFDPISMRSLPGRKVPLADFTGGWSFSADRSVLAIGHAVTCPAGQMTTIGPPQRSGMRAAIFPIRLCRACPMRSRCAPGGRGRKIDLRRREDLLQAGREALADPECREHLRRTRPLIERLLGLLVHRYHARKSRYRGRRKACFQAAWTAVLVNLHPIEAALTESAT